MSWTLSSGDFLRAGIIVYVGMWIYLRFKEWNVNRQAPIDVFKVSNYEWRSKLIKSLGWIVALLIGLAGIIIIPEVYIVSQNKPAITDDPYQYALSVRESFNVEHKYVLFYYNGNICAPFDKYISNETDSTLVLYLTELFNGTYNYVSSPEDFKEVPAHYIMKCNNGFNKFERPYEREYIHKRNRYKQSFIWTLDLREFAERDRNDIWHEIQMHKGTCLPDSFYIGKFKVPIPCLDSIKPLKYRPRINIKDLMIEKE